MTAGAETSSIAVRRAGPLDAACMAALHASSFARSWDAASMAPFLAAPNCLCLLVACEPGAPVHGILIARRAGDEAELLTLAVDPAWRRRGLGRALLVDAMQALRAAEVKHLFLEVEEGNDAARSLYESLGAIPVGRRLGYYEHGADADIFWLAL